MVNQFLEIPDWPSFENDGCGVALADLNGSGQPDVLVLRVDAPVGQNAGFYRVGRDLDEGGQPSDWGGWMQIPNWFSWSNQGVGLAIADLDGSGLPDLIVFIIDNPLEQNRGLYRVGRNLDKNGVVTGGWEEWKEIPGWFSWNNDGGSIAIADLNGNGQLDLLVFMIDAPDGANRGLYKVGRDLDFMGAVKGGWSEWQQIPKWFSHSNQGAGIAIADLSNTGTQDVIFFHVDNALTQNQGFYKIARNLQPDGTVAEKDWSPWYGVPSWFSWENQGANVAVAKRQNGLNVEHDLVVVAVDNAIGQNLGLLQSVPLSENPAIRGKWELLPYDSELLAVHAGLLPKGDVLFFAGSGNSGVRFFAPEFGDTTKENWCSVVWDYAQSQASGEPQFFHPDTLRNGNNRPIDFFCGGECFLPDGRLLVAGGTLEYDVDAHNKEIGHGFFGRPDALIFDFNSRQWTTVASMKDGRWYPTLILLGDGRVLAASGLDKKGNLNETLELYDATTNKWETRKVPKTLASFLGLPLYAHLLLMADGRVFFTGGRMDDIRTTESCLIDLKTNPVGLTPISGLQAALSRNQSASVLLAPAQDQKVLIMGGAFAIGEADATDKVDVIEMKDLSGALPSYQAAASLLLPRVHLNAVLLPDRTVFVNGGALQREGGDVRKVTARFQSEIYDPATNTWKLGATAQVERMYHSVSLLLPDGRVVAASGNPDKGGHVKWVKDDPDEELRLEVYSPPYLFQGKRPTITNAPDTCIYGETIEINSPETGQIKWASLTSNGVTTHSFNTNQRVVDLEILSQNAGTIKARVPTNKNIAPPGFYMLFLADNAGIPSIAHWVQLQ